MLNMQNVKDIEIQEGDVRTIHDKDNRLIWGRLAYDTKYAGDTVQDGTPTPDAPIPVQVVTGEQTVTIGDGASSQSYEINLGKNLFGASDGTVEYKGVTQTLSDNNHLTIVGTATENYPVSRNLTATLYSPIPAGTYTITIIGTMDGTASKGLNMTFYDKNGTEVVTGAGILLNVPQQRVFDRPIYAIKWFRNMLTGATIDFDLRIQIEAGSSASPYAPYLTPIELCKIGTYQDYIYKSGDDWYVHKRCGKVVYNGSEDWGLWAASAEQPRRLGLRDTALWFKNSMMLVSNYFIRTTYSESQTDLTIWTQTQYLAITDKNSYWSSYTDFKTWLSTHNLIVYYELRTPTDTQITDATLIGQLNAVHEWLTRYGYSATVTGNLPIIINQTNL